MSNEIEIKALLTKEKYSELKSVLPQRFKKINEDTITTVKFKPHDIRIRFSDKIQEVVLKDVDPTKFSRKEISINLEGIDDCHNMISLLRGIGLEEHPSWITNREEFTCQIDNHKYTLSLQHIENFAYILEAEIISDNAEKHIPNLKKIIKDLGCEPIEAEQFKNKIKEYITKYG